ncbi:hypothetical protein KIN20_027259 [Parelaphostrongylus tenuis]|uniref:Uncharacterized protein n=1 Tax=Parelaphostrongylus tenuis TaxID=148309 RepID=A0AAD5QZ66_PARTN|nr:hypothetical protein KIN20_027259 [Parelaphostrongylus tenuis]
MSTKARQNPHELYLIMALSINITLLMVELKKHVGHMQSVEVDWSPALELTFRASVIEIEE